MFTSLRTLAGRALRVLSQLIQSTGTTADHPPQRQALQEHSAVWNVRPWGR